MKAKLITYWIATILICGQMAFAAFAYLTRQPKVMEAFSSLGYPQYFPMILGTAKVLGVLALLVPGLPMLKEWAYAGFTFTFIGAAWSHAASNQTSALLMPITALVVLTISCLLRPASRRVTATHHLPATHDTAGDVGLPHGGPAQ
jgi:hypothetical protein